MHLINIGMQALQAGDDVMVQRITELLRERGLHHV
jgi:hypothetical protein